VEQIRVYAFPLLLLAGASWLVVQEIRHFRSELAQGHAPWVRFLRRLAGAAILVAVAAMVHLGDTSSAALTRGQLVERFNYWMAVLGLVLLAMGLALWDVVDGLRRLGSYLEEVEKDEVQTLKERLKERES